MRPCSRLLALAACISTSGGLTGCAYVEYRRTYALSVSVPETERAPLSDALDHFFAQRGLVLKQKYRDLYPRNVLASAFEIPRTRAELHARLPRPRERRWQARSVGAALHLLDGRAG
jgi:hypothetical protein